MLFGPLKISDFQVWTLSWYSEVSRRLKTFHSPIWNLGCSSNHTLTLLMWSETWSAIPKFAVIRRSETWCVLLSKVSNYTLFSDSAKLIAYSTSVSNHLVKEGDQSLFGAFFHWRKLPEFFVFWQTARSGFYDVSSVWWNGEPWYK